MSGYFFVVRHIHFMASSVTVSDIRDTIYSRFEDPPINRKPIRHEIGTNLRSDRTAFPLSKNTNEREYPYISYIHIHSTSHLPSEVPNEQHTQLILSGVDESHFICTFQRGCVDALLPPTPIGLNATLIPSSALRGILVLQIYILITNAVTTIVTYKLQQWRLKLTWKTS